MKESKVCIGNNKLTKEEIEANENFDQLLKKHQQFNWKKKAIVGGLIGAGVFLIVALALYFNSQKNNLEVNSVKKEQSEKEETKGIKPLLKVELEKEIFYVDAEEGGTFKYQNSVVDIPENAFVDSAGNPITGKVEIAYKEFHNPVDFIISGIPMTYDSAGVEYHFESAGMFDIRGFQNGNPVFLTKSIEVKLQSFQEEDFYNKYYYEEKEEKWKFISKDTLLKKSTKIGVEDKKSELELKELKKKLALIKKEEPKEKTKGSTCIKLEMDSAEFPEFVGFKEVLFEIDKRDKNFDESLALKEWDDIKLKKREGFFELIFYKKFKKTVLRANPVYSSEKIAEALRVYNRINKKTIESLEEAIKERKKQKESFTNEVNSSSSVANFVTRIFVVNSFGIYNSDYPQRMPKGQSIATVYLQKSDKEEKDTLVLKKLYLVEENKNVLYNLYLTGTLTYNPNNKCVLWGVNDSDKLVVLKSEDFAKIPLNYKETYNLEFEVVEKDLYLEEQIKKELDIESLF